MSGVFDQLGDSVFRRRYQSLDLNIGVVVGEDGVLVVDTRASHQQAVELREELSRLTKKPVRWVVNTHWHWDHVFGNSRFPDAEIWGHELARSALVSRGEEMKDGAKKWLPEDLHPVIDEVEIVPPQQTFSQRASIEIGRTVDLAYFGLAHTDADIIVSVPDSNVTFMGDIIEESAPPGFGDSFPLSWPDTLRRAAKDAREVCVPGHGDIVDKDFVANQLNDLTAVADLVSRVVGGELDRGGAARQGPYSEEVMRSALERVVVA